MAHRNRKTKTQKHALKKTEDRQFTTSSQETDRSYFYRTCTSARSAERDIVFPSPSVCPSNAGIVVKQYILSNFFHHHTTYSYEILKRRGPGTSVEYPLDCLLGLYTGPDLYTLLNGFSLLVIFSFFFIKYSALFGLTVVVLDSKRPLIVIVARKKVV